MKRVFIFTFIFCITVYSQIIEEVKREIDYFQLAKDCLEVNTGFTDAELEGLQKAKEHYAEYYIGDAIRSKVIIIGKTIEKVDSINPLYSLQIEEVLKGEEILINKFGKIPKQIIYSDGGIFFGCPSPKPNIEGIHFFWRYGNESLQKFTESTLFFYNDKVVYERLFDLLKYTPNKINSSRWIKSSRYRKHLRKRYQEAIYGTFDADEVLSNIKRTLDKDDPINSKKYKSRVFF